MENHFATLLEHFRHELWLILLFFPTGGGKLKQSEFLDFEITLGKKFRFSKTS